MKTSIIQTLTETATLRRLRGLNELTGESLTALLACRADDAGDLRHLRGAPIGVASLTGWLLLSEQQPMTAQQLLGRLSVSLPRFPRTEEDLPAHATLIIAVLARADELRRAEQAQGEGGGLHDEDIQRVLGRPELWDYQTALSRASLAPVRGQPHPEFTAQLRRLTAQPVMSPPRPHQGAQG